MSKYSWIVKEQQLKKLGLSFLGLAFLFSLGTYILPTEQAGSWLSPTNKQGIYVLSALFVFFGFYCLGATWRQRDFM